MKSQIKDIVIGIFAVIGFTAIVMGFTVQTQERPKITSIKDQNANDDTQILALKVEINKLKSQIAWIISLDETPLLLSFVKCCVMSFGMHKTN